MRWYVVLLLFAVGAAHPLIAQEPRTVTAYEWFLQDI
jgi:hypothetical protein